MEQLKNILFVDIETVCLVPSFDALSERMKTEWERKARHLKSHNIENPTASMLFTDKAGIFSEFAKVVCIGFGSLQFREEQWSLRLKALTNHDENVLLKDFSELITRFTGFYPDLRFCGHNIKEFDIPFLCRRMVINGMALPQCMQLSGKKPWEISHLDTLELWRFGDYKHYTSLSLLAEVLDIPSPKDDMDGSMVGDTYWNEGDLPRIAKYCMQDVLTSARVFLKLRGMNNIDPEPVFLED